MKSTCAKCGHIFSSVTTFDMHRVGSYRKRERRCLAEIAMTSLGLVQNDKSWWGERLRIFPVPTMRGIVDEENT